MPPDEGEKPESESPGTESEKAPLEKAEPSLADQVTSAVKEAIRPLSERLDALEEDEEEEEEEEESERTSVSSDSWQPKTVSELARGIADMAKAELREELAAAESDKAKRLEAVNQTFDREIQSVRDQGKSLTEEIETGVFTLMRDYGITSFRKGYDLYEKVQERMGEGSPPKPNPKGKARMIGSPGSEQGKGGGPKFYRPGRRVSEVASDILNELESGGEPG